MAALVSGVCPYAVLGLHYGASVDEVRAAFRRAALRTHPDKQGGSCEAFNAVQRAHDLLLGHCGVDLYAAATFGFAQEQQLWAQVQQQQQQPQTFWPGAAVATAVGGQPGGSCASNAAAATFDRWSSTAFDPWSSDGFDPWSSATFDPWSSTALGACSEASAPGPSSSPAPPQAGPAVESCTTAAGDASSAVAVQPEKRLKRKRRPDPATVRPLALPRWRKGKGKGGEKGLVPVVEFNRELMRNGVYGFRPSSSSEDESDVEVAAPRPPPGMSAATYRPEAATASCGATRTPLGSRGCQERAPLKQFYCSRHNRIRFEDALVDDGEGKPVCRPGMECP
mmetsp:Transcript_45985/g.133242  ORF Transcript_45985/g.133242 Transcript_45985/m.133242 type:complete len:338 (-) Transcript_45985:96-1109(-)